MKVRILRIVAGEMIISAESFELNLKSFSPEKFQIDYVTIGQLGEMFSSRYTADGRRRCLNLFRRYDFFSPGFGAFLQIPLYLQFRNQNHINTSLLFISHAPGGHVFEFYLMAEMLRGGDLIVAPTRNAAETIKLIYPALSPYIRVVNHPIRSLVDLRAGEKVLARDSPPSDDKYLVAFTRIHPDKLLHRAVEAIDILKSKGKTVKLLIAGRLTVDGGSKSSTYAAILAKKVESLGLVDEVRFLGEIRDPGEKATYLKHSVALLNLSVTLEESFGKSIVEALSVGTPVIVTNWNGFNETVGRCGVYVPVVLENGFADISSGDLAEAMEEMCDHNRIYRKHCLRHYENFTVTRIEKKYYELLQNRRLSPEVKKITDSGDSATGLMDSIAAVKEFDRREIFEMYLEYLNENIKGKPNQVGTGGILRSILLLSVSKVLRAFLAGKEYRKQCFALTADHTPFRNDDFFSRLLTSVLSYSNRYSKELSLLFCLGRTELDYFGDVLKKLRAVGGASEGIKYLEVEYELLKGDFQAADRIWNRYYLDFCFGERDYLKVRQRAKIDRKLGSPARSIPLLKKWLDEFAYSPLSLPIWTDLCFQAIEAGSNFFRDADEAFVMVRSFSEDESFVERLRRKLILAKMTVSPSEDTVSAGVTISQGEQNIG